MRPTLAHRLSEYIAAAFTGLWIHSHEHEDALAAIASLWRERMWPLAIWDVGRGLQINGQQGGCSVQKAVADRRLRQGGGRASPQSPRVATRQVGARDFAPDFSTTFS
jgi:hypothetical protein